MSTFGIKVLSPEHVKAIEIEAFKKGISWNVGAFDPKPMNFLKREVKYIIIHGNEKIMTYSNSDSLSCNFPEKDISYLNKFEDDPSRTFVKGQWYTLKSGLHNVLICYNNFNNSYGWSCGEWRDTWILQNIKDYEPVPIDQVIKRFEKELANMGFKNGTEFEFHHPDTILGTGKTTMLNDGFVSFESKDGIIAYSNNKYIFYKGKWATIISKKPKLPIIDGHPIQVDNDENIRINGEKIPTDWFTTKGTINVKEFTLTNGIKFTYNEIRAIENYLKWYFSF